LVDVLGYDIGGANVKAVFMSKEKGKLQEVRVASKYFPIWKKPQKLSQVLNILKKELDVRKAAGLAVTMTAELSDAYQTKREGVKQILSCVEDAFPEIPIYILDNSAELLSISTALEEPLSVAAANWCATGWLVAQQLMDCVIVDVGSTSTSIIPVLNGKVIALGKTDLDKLLCGELVYTGSLRTNVAAIVQKIPIKGGVAGISSELFALSADVHLVLGNINEKEYTSETADGRKKSISEALARLSRVVCADTEILAEEEIRQMAKYIHRAQVLQVARNLSRVYKRVDFRNQKNVPIVVTGLGGNFIARKAAEKIGAIEIVDLGSLVQDEAVYATPAFGVALMLANKLEGN
jgi:(4-(4-[2-(gamma-L-glutamylamino)ethyl]phenoxymethyl)furan-2-yl)methanamine synthase